MVRTWMEACKPIYRYTEERKFVTREGVEFWNFLPFFLRVHSAQEIPDGVVYKWVSDSLRMEEKSGPAVITSLLPQVCNTAMILASEVSFPPLFFQVYLILTDTLKNCNNQETDKLIPLPTLMKNLIKSLCSSEPFISENTLNISRVCLLHLQLQIIY